MLLHNRPSWEFLKKKQKKKNKQKNPGLPPERWALNPLSCHPMQLLHRPQNIVHTSEACCWRRSDLRPSRRSGLKEVEPPSHMEIGPPSSALGPPRGLALLIPHSYSNDKLQTNNIYQAGQSHWGVHEEFLNFCETFSRLVQNIRCCFVQTIDNGRLAEWQTNSYDWLFEISNYCG